MSHFLIYFSHCLTNYPYLGVLEAAALYALIGWLSPPVLTAKILFSISCPGTLSLAGWLLQTARSPRNVLIDDVIFVPTNSYLRV
jgi:hypothetical protein